ncbi:MAG: carbon storage regulator [Proteobacteria bacterium]|nr:carbon storage regulator [Pseudomonadota bacterium]
MLLITRREGEAIVINGSIEVKVLEIRGGRVKLGFEYPSGSSVFRQELFAKIQAENQAAALPGKVPAADDAKRLTAAVQKLQPKPKPE